MVHGRICASALFRGVGEGGSCRGPCLCVVPGGYARSMKSEIGYAFAH